MEGTDVESATAPQPASPQRRFDVKRVASLAFMAAAIVMIVVTVIRRWPEFSSAILLISGFDVVGDLGPVDGETDGGRLGACLSRTDVA